MDILPLAHEKAAGYEDQLNSASKASISQSFVVNPACMAGVTRLAEIHREGANVLFCDGRAMVFADDIPRSLLIDTQSKIIVIFPRIDDPRMLIQTP